MSQQSERQPVNEELIYLKKINDKLNFFTLVLILWIVLSILGLLFQ